MDTAQLQALRQEFHPASDNGKKNAVSDYLLVRKILRLKRKKIIEGSVSGRRNVDVIMHSYETKVNEMTTNKLKKEYENLVNSK